MSQDQPDPYQPAASPYEPPVLQAQILDEEGDGTGGLIPYKNPQALTAYYLAVFSLIPCFGVLLGIPAVVLGIMGLSARKRNPAIKGSAHAWVGIILGGGTTLLWIALVVAMFVFQAR